MIWVVQVVAAGESFAAVVKVGYNVKRTWSVYQHCQSKLKKLQDEWIALGGNFTTIGELAAELHADYGDDSEDESYTLVEHLHIKLV
jgi:hypothetical protein